MEESDLPKFDSGLLDLDLEGFSSLFNTPEEEDFGGTEDFCNDGHGTSSQQLGAAGVLMSGLTTLVCECHRPQ